MSELQPPNTVTEKQSSEEIKANLEHSLEKEIEVSVAQAKQYKSEKKSQKSWLGFLLLISVGINGIGLWQMSSPSQEPSSATVAAKERPPRAVEVTSLTSGNTTSNVQLLGQVESPQQATIRAQTRGVIKNVLVQAGDKVTPGMAIAILDDADQKLALSKAEAELAQERNNLARLEVGTRPEIIAQRRAALSSAQAREREAVDNLRRNSELVKQGALAQRLLVEARAAVDQARGERLEAKSKLAEAEAGPTREEIAAQRANVAAAVAGVNQAKLAMTRTRISAGSGGVVLQRQVSPGDYIETGGEIATLVAREKLDIFLELPEQLSGRVAAGSKVELTARALPQWRGNATITGVIPSTDAASRRQRVRVRLDNPPQGLLPGMAITGNLQLSGNTRGLVVSRDALTRREDRWLVFTVEDGKAKELAVEVVADMGEKVAISGTGLQNGQTMVLCGGDGLRDGAKVKVVGR